MKRIAAIFLGLTLAASIGFAQSAKNYVEVLYFHGAQRCITCNAIEKHTKELIEANYAKEIKDGSLVFKVVDISKKENEKTADKYKVTFSSLFVSVNKDGKETTDNMTKFGFSTARFKSDEFKAGIKKKIDESLKAVK